MNKAQASKKADAPVSLEEIARRMLAMPPKERADLVKKKPKKRARKA